MDTRKRKRPYVVCQNALDFVRSLRDGSVRLAVLDPPYYNVVSDDWDRQWKTSGAYVKWLYRILRVLRRKLTPDGSLLLFGAIGHHNERPFLDLMRRIERKNLYQNRNWITWAKRRAYGKSHDYLFLREELVWYSAATGRTDVVFNIPHTAELRGYEGFNKKYPAKSPYKRVGNVWMDIPELMRTRRTAEKPAPLLERIVTTHSNPGDLVIDCFCGLGVSGVTALKLGREFKGADRDKDAVRMANKSIKLALDQT